MKQLIVMLSTVLLGIAIAALVLGFKTPANNLNNGVNKELNNVFSDYGISAGYNTAD